MCIVKERKGCGVQVHSLFCSPSAAAINEISVLVFNLLIGLRVEQGFSWKLRTEVHEQQRCSQLHRWWVTRTILAVGEDGRLIITNQKRECMQTFPVRLKLEAFGSLRAGQFYLEEGTRKKCPGTERALSGSP